MTTVNQALQHSNLVSSAHAGEIPRPKRIACVICRKRKLRCDGTRPSCGTCSRLGHDCAYDEVRRKSGPKRGYVKALEARLAQVETLLKNKEATTTNAVTNLPDTAKTLSADPTIHISNKANGLAAIQTAQERYDANRGWTPDSSSHGSNDHSKFPEDSNLTSATAMEDITVGWDIMSLGVEEPLPSPEVQDALHKVFFEKVYPSAPILHRGRYLQSLNLAPHMRPPTCLRYAIWTMAASIDDEYFHLQTHFYRMARKYVEDTELKGHGELLVNVAMAQTWIFIACYEFKLMYFPRAWMSTGRAVRLSQMMGLHRLDGSGLDVKQCLPPPNDWTEREERRRTFWVAFCVDRYASIGTGWPMTIEEQDVMTDLPASEEAFEQGRPSRSLTLKDAMTPDGARHLSPFAGVVLMACLFGRNLTHLHRPDENDDGDDLNGEFWRRHRHMDNILLNIALSLPSQFKLPHGINNPNIIFVNMNIHTSTICLHQAAIFKAEKNQMSATVSQESKIRCITAAAQIASIMRMIAHMDISGMNPFLSFCLYVAARVFVQYLKSRKDEQVKASLEFLLTAMGHMKKKTPLTESFLVQLDVDLAGMLDNPAVQAKFPYGLKRGEAEIYISSSGGARQSPDGQMSEANPPHQQEPPNSSFSSPSFLFCSSPTAKERMALHLKLEREKERERERASHHTYTTPGSNATSPSNSMEASESASSGFTPASSADNPTPHQTPSNHSSYSFSPMEPSMDEPIGIQYQGMNSFQPTGLTPMASGGPLSPLKEIPWDMLDFDNSNPELAAGMNLYNLFQGGTSFTP